MTKPILKWAGGKRQLLDELYERFPQKYGSYHEPFFGGGALFFDLEPQNGTINDTNPRLNNFYKQVRNQPEQLIKTLQSLKEPEAEPSPGLAFSETNRKGREIKNYYYQQRERFNNRPYGDEYDKLEEAALLLYLNRTCYNGLYRENQDGGFNSPIGSYSNPDWVQATRIRKASKVLEGTEVFNRDFDYIISETKEGDLVYFDPPYEPMNSTASFNDYSKEGFGREEQEKLLQVAKQLNEMGVYVILSNSGVMYDMYESGGFSVGIEGATRAINSDASNRGEVDEIIATNIPSEDWESNNRKGITDY